MSHELSHLTVWECPKHGPRKVVTPNHRFSTRCNYHGNGSCHRDLVPVRVFREDDVKTLLAAATAEGYADGLHDGRQERTRASL